MERDRGYTDQDMAEVSDNPEWTADDFARARPFAEAFPDLAESLRQGVEVVRTGDAAHLSLTLSGDVAAYYASFGDEAEARLAADLRKVSGLA